MIPKQIPTFLLKKINPSEILKKYQDGHYFRPIPQKRKFSLSTNCMTLAPVYSRDENDPIFALKTKNNNTAIFATSNSKNYEVLHTDKENIKDGGRCDYCKVDFNHEAIGYPITYEEKQLLMGLENEIPRYKIFYIFWTEGCNCSFECCLAHLLSKTNVSVCTQDALTADSCELLHLLYRLTYPYSKKLVPAQDFRLLKSNGGPLSEKEWKDNKHQYIRTTRVVTLPCKVTYLMKSLTN